MTSTSIWPAGRCQQIHQRAMIMRDKLGMVRRHIVALLLVWSRPVHSTPVPFHSISTSVWMLCWLAGRPTNRTDQQGISIVVVPSDNTAQTPVWRYRNNRGPSNKAGRLLGGWGQFPPRHHIFTLHTPLRTMFWQCCYVAARPASGVGGGSNFCCDQLSLS